MLRHLSIRNFAIVEAIELEFNGGFTALTGETGAGKSILIDALALALGERADADQVKAGAERAEVCAEFSLAAGDELRAWLAELALEGDAPGESEALLLRRVLDRGGRSRAFINGRPATLAQLREAGERLVDIHGQHAHQSLLRPEAQRRILDAHAGLVDLARQAGEAYRDWQKLVRSRVDRTAHSVARNAEREQLAWQVGELAKLAPKAGEWAGIGAEHTRLSHAASLVEGARSALDALSESEGAALGAVSGAKSALKALLGYDAALGEPMALLDSAEAQIAEAAHALRRYADRVELDPARLREVEERLEGLHAAARRYRVDPEDLAATLDSLQGRLAELEIASDLEELIKHEQQSLLRYRELAAGLTAERRKAAARLAKEVTSAMKELAMKGGRLDIALVPYPEGSAHGNESVEFLVATGAGMEPRPLAKVASGGELSRISLAIQVITSRAAAVPTLIFDEVDAGIGGAVAEVVGRKLRSLGESRQVLCVTHLPQVAAQASEQWSVAKAGADGKAGATSRVKVLDAKARIEEIARMLGGLEITATTRRHAAEMLGLHQTG